MRARSRRRACVAAIAASCVVAPSMARAECDPSLGCVSVDGYWPKPGASRFAGVADVRAPARGSYALTLAGTFVQTSLRAHVATPGPDGTDATVVDKQIGETLVGSFGIVDRVALYGALPITVAQWGDGTAPLGGRPLPTTSLREPRAGAAVAILRRKTERGLSLTAFAETQAPTHATSDFNGERGWTFAPAVSTELRLPPRVSVGLELGGRLRPAPSRFVDLRQGQELLTNLGVSVDLLPLERLAVGAEAWTRIAFDASGNIVGTGAASHIDGGTQHALFGMGWLATVRTSLVGRTLTLLGGAGTGVPLARRPLGAAAFRAVLTLSYVPGMTEATSAQRTTAPSHAPAAPKSGEKAAGEKTTDEKAAGDQPADENAAGDQPADENAAGDQPADENAAGDQPTGEKSPGDEK